MDVIESFELNLDPEDLLQRMKLGDDAETRRSAEALVARAREVARPRALYSVAYVEKTGEETVRVEEQTFTSRVLRVNLDAVERVFPYIVTCGVELEEMPLPPEDFMAPYLMDALKLSVLGQATGQALERIRERYRLGKTARMNPGSLEDWPMAQQAPLFALFGDVESLIGVRLTESYLMYPIKSVSGFLYPTEASFESCQLCPREKCPGRRTDYEPELAAKYGI